MYLNKYMCSAASASYYTLWPCVAKLFILHQVAQRPSYGGRLKKQLAQLGYNISPGSLYPLLHQLEQSGLVRSWVKVYKGRVRRHYEITPAGHQHLQRLRAELATVAAELLAPPREAPEPEETSGGNGEE